MNEDLNKIPEKFEKDEQKISDDETEYIRLIKGLGVICDFRNPSQ